MHKPSLVYVVGWVLLILSTVTYQRWTNQATINCVVKVVASGNQSSKELRVATNARDKADYRVKYWAIKRLKPLSDPHVQNAWVEYQVQTLLLDKSRKDNPPVDIRRLCR